MRSAHVIGGVRRHATAQSKTAATTAELNPRLVMAVLAVGMIVGALLTAPTKSAGPAADLASRTSHTSGTR